MEAKKARGWFIYSVILWAASIICIITSYFRPLMGLLVIFFPAIFVEWGMFVLKLKRHSCRLPDHLLHQTPKIGLVLAGAAVLYTLFNFLINMMILAEGGPEIQDGVYCLWNHGFVREISYQEYVRLQFAEARLFSGHLLLFSTLPMVYFSGYLEKNHQK